MEFILLRHAKAADGAPDEARPLTAKGVRHARRVGELLRERALLPDVVVSSPATRAWDTATHACAGMGFGAAIHREPALYGATRGDILSVLAAYAAAHRPLLVGHNPGFEDFAQHVGGLGEGWKFRKGTAAVFRVAGADVALVDLVDPR